MASTWYTSGSDYNYGSIDIQCTTTWENDPLHVGPDQDVTIEFWSKLQYSNYRIIVDKSLADYWVGWGVAGTSELDAGWYGDGGYTSVHSEMAPVAGAWHHYAICIDRTSSDTDVATFWKDGAQVGSAINADRSVTGHNTGDLYLLADYAGGHVYLGDVDELRISSCVRFIPEPTTISLLAIAALAFLKRKK